MSKNQYNLDTVTKTRVMVTPRLLEWWETLNQQQKILYCEIHPISDLTLGHLGEKPFKGMDATQMRQYHQQQADDLKLCLIGAIDLESKETLVQLYHLQLGLAVQ